MNNWQEQFDEEVIKSQSWGGGKFGALDDVAEFSPDFDGVKDFITTLLEKQREEIEEKIEKIQPLPDEDWYDAGVWMKKRIINLIKSHDNTQT